MGTPFVSRMLAGTGFAACLVVAAACSDDAVAPVSRAGTASPGPVQGSRAPGTAPSGEPVPPAGTGAETAEPVAPDRAAVPPLRGREPRPHVIDRPLERRAVEVIVRGPDGTPVSGANVRLVNLSDAGRNEGTTDRDGRFRVEWTWGRWYVAEAWTEDADWRRASLLGTTSLVGGDGPFEIRLVRSVPVRGVVMIPAADSPLPPESPPQGDVRIAWGDSVADAPPGVAEVAAGDGFVLHLAPGTRGLDVAAVSRDDVLPAHVPVVPGGPPLEIRLERGVPIRCFVRDRGGVGFQGKCTSWAWRDGDPEARTSTTFSDYGEMETAAVPRDGRWNVLVSCVPRSGGIGELSWGIVRGTGREDTPFIDLAPARRIAGSVVDDTGAPAPVDGAIVYAAFDETNLLTARGVATEDEFVLERVPPVPLRISIVSVDGLLARSDRPVPEHASRTVLLRRAPIAVSGRVVDPDGRPVAAGVVGVDGAPEFLVHGQPGKLDARGRFRVLVPEPGPVRLRWSCESLTDVDLGEVDAPDGDVVVSIRK